MFLTWRAPLLVVLGLVAVFWRPQASTSWAWFALVVGLIALDVVLAGRPKNLLLSRSGTLRTRPETPVETVLTVANPGRRRAVGWVRDAWQPSAGARHNRHRFSLRAGAESAVSTVLVPTRRGELTAQRVTLRTLGPLRLAGRQFTGAVSGRLRVWPAFPSIKHLPSRVARLRELDGRSVIRTRGAGTEFDSLRDYVRGDDVRSIDWRASARTSKVVVRTWRPERDRRIVIVIDSGRTSAARIADVPRLDSALDAALLLASLAQKAGDRVDLVAGDRQPRVIVKGSHEADAMIRLQDKLADLQPALSETNWTRLHAAVNQLGRQRALVVLLTPIDPAAILHAIGSLVPLARRHRVLVGSVSDPELVALARARDTNVDTYAAAAAEAAGQQRRELAALLGTMGIDVLDAPADELPPRLADRYLALKAAGKL